MIDIPTVDVIEPIDIGSIFQNMLVDASGNATTDITIADSIDLFKIIFEFSLNAFSSILGQGLLLTLILGFYFVSIWMRSNSLPFVFVTMGVVLSIVATGASITLSAEILPVFVLTLIAGLALIFYKLFFANRG